MYFYTSPVAIAIIISMLSAQQLSVFSEKLSRLFACVSLALHVAISPVLLFGGADLAELSFIYMLSAFSVTLSIYVKSLRKKSGAGAEEEENDV